MGAPRAPLTCRTQARDSGSESDEIQVYAICFVSHMTRLGRVPLTEQSQVVIMMTNRGNTGSFSLRLRVGH